MFIAPYLNQVAPGVWQRNQIIKSESIYMIEHYKEAWLQILNSDKVHYANLLPVIKSKMPEIIGRYKKIVCPGGGFPKFETQILKATDISVIDLIADIYVDQLDSFKQIYSIAETTQISYLKSNTLSPFKVQPEYECVCFTHFLEHSESWEIVKDWIQLQQTDIVIYGPNIEAATSINWHHYHDHNVDHNVFFTIAAIKSLAEQSGYTVKSLAYSDDLLVWMRKG